MRAWFAFLTLMVAGSVGAEETPEQQLGSALVAAISERDVVGYSHCWFSMRQMEGRLKDLGVVLPDEEMGKMAKYMLARNKDIAESFTRIQELLDERSVDRPKLSFSSCVASNVQKRPTPNGTHTMANDFKVVFVDASGAEWRFSIDDGVFDGAAWYFSDSPTSLFVGDTSLRFRKSRREANKAPKRTP